MNIAVQSEKIFTTHTPPRTWRDLPGPRGVPLLGNAPQIQPARFHLILEEWAKEYGALYKFQLGPQRAVVVSDPELSRQILRARPDGFRRTSSIERVQQEMGILGVFGADGETWRRQRKLTTQALSSKYLVNFFPTLIRITERLRNRWLSAAQRGESVDAQSDLMRFTVDVTTNLAFGYDFNTLEQKDGALQIHLARIMEMMGTRTLAPFPYWHYFKLPADRALDESLRVVHKMIRECIANARQRMKADPTLRDNPSNLLEAMLAFDGVADEDGESLEFSDEEIVGNVFTFLSAGEDTAANTMAWMMYYLCREPKLQQQLQLEADAVLGVQTMATDMRGMEQFAYTEAVIHETMRLRPVTPLIGAETNQDVIIAGVEIPKGTIVLPLTRPANLLSENYFHAQEFLPERWLHHADAPQAASRCPVPHHTAENVAHNPNASIPFGYGPRLCPGRSLAMLEIKMAMAMLSRNFEVAAVSELDKVREVYQFTMKPEGLMVRLTERRASSALANIRGNENPTPERNKAMNQNLDAAIARYQNFFETLTDSSVEEFRNLATTNVRYRDPLMDAQGIEAVVAGLHKWFRDLEGLKMRVHSSARAGNTVYQHWTISYRLKKMPKDSIEYEGMSLLTFGADGKIQDQVDYWDAAPMYAIFPLLGKAVTLIHKIFTQG